MRLIKTVSKINLVVAAFIVLISVIPMPAKAKAKTVTSTELIEEATALDGKSVSYQGEVVGDILYRGDHAWVSINDGENAVSAYVPAMEAKKIKYTGRYCVTGDTVSLTGTFHRACTEHGGDLDIHSNKVKIIKRGYAVKDKSSPAFLIASIIMFPCALAGLIIVIRKKASYNKACRKGSIIRR